MQPGTEQTLPPETLATPPQPQMAVQVHEPAPVFNPISVAEHVEGDFTEYLLRRTKNGEGAISILEDEELIQVSSSKRDKDGTIHTQQHLMVKKEALLGVSHKKFDWLDKYRVGWWTMIAGGLGLSVIANPIGALLLAGGLFLSIWQIVDPELLVLETSTGKHPFYLNRMGSDRDLMKCSMDHLSSAMKSLLKTGELDCSGYEGAVGVLMAERASIIQNQAEAAAVETPSIEIPQQPVAVQEVQSIEPVAEETVVTPEETPTIPEVSDSTPEQVVETPEPKEESTEWGDDPWALEPEEDTAVEDEPAPEEPPLELPEPAPPVPTPVILSESSPPPEAPPVELPEPAPPPELMPVELPEPAPPPELIPVELPEPAPPPVFSATPTLPPPPAPAPPPGLAPMTPLPPPPLGLDLPPLPPGVIGENLGLGILAPSPLPPQALVAASPRQENLSTEDKDDLLSALGD